MQVLFTCEGTSDPVRGFRDGPILHILRRYRPRAVVVFASAEIMELDAWDNRHAKLREFMRAAWDYVPEWHTEPLELREVQDLDQVYAVMEPAVKKYLRKYEKEEILVNVTSGTPQMQSMMIDLAKDSRYVCRAIQVANPARAAGQGGRTNDKNNYRVDEQLQGNLDQQPEQCNRCAEVQMIAVDRRNEWEKVRGILEQRDFEAASRIDSLTVDSARMLEHLRLRSRLDQKGAYAIARSLMMAEELFPVRFLPEDREAERICEYYLILRNMQKSGSITEFILRLNPFVVHLQIAHIDRLLREQYGFTLEDITTNAYPNRMIFTVEKLRQQSAELLDKLQQNFGRPLRDADMSIKLGVAFLRSLNAPDTAGKVYRDCDKLNDFLRNPAAHDLKHFTEGDCRKLLRYSSADLIRQIEGLIPMVFPQYPEEVFRAYYQVYDRGIDYIKKKYK